MRLAALTLASLFLMASVLPAQQPPAGAPGVPAPGLNPQNRLDAVLLQWEQTMKGVDSVYIPELTRTETDKIGGRPRVYTGEARYLAPNFAALRMTRQDDPSYWEMLVSDGTRAYQFRPKTKKVYVYDIPKQLAGQFKSNLLSVVFGTNAAGIKQRFDLTLAKEKEGFIYIAVAPRTDSDKQEFIQAEFVLRASNMLPVRIWFERSNGNSERWDIPKLDTGKKLTPADFAPPKVPADWETVRGQDQ